MLWNFSALYSKTNQAGKTGSQGGFGLVELMVSISIMVIISTTIIVSQSTFNSAVLLRGQAYDIALAAREVQLTAISASGDTTAGQDFRSALGLSFSKKSQTDLLYNGVYRTFRADNSVVYDSANEFGVPGILDTRFEVKNITHDGTIFSSPEEVSIVFQRPNFDAKFYNRFGASLDADTLFIKVGVRGRAGTSCGEVRTIEFTKTGQISVLPCSP
ncbi:type II secretion system protein [Candidatus Nomurabacteria bacterium]|nr:type II secretion system protein [Candidatus Nomurabacteria bacterium]